MRVEFKSSIPLNLDPYETSIVEITGAVKLTVEDDSEIEAATMSLYSVDYKSIQETGERDFFQIMDAISHSLMEISNVFYNRHGLKVKFAEDQFISSPNLLHVENVHVKKDFRYIGMGRIMFDRAMRLFGRSHGIITVNPYPLQFMGNDTDMDFCDLPINEAAATKKLREVYESWGFYKIAGSKYMFQNSDDWFSKNPYPLGLSYEKISQAEKILHGDKKVLSFTR